MFRQKQFRVLIGMFAAIIVGVVIALYWSWGTPDPLPQNSGERLAFVARWILPPGLALLVGIGATANRRFFTADAIDGERRVDNYSFEVNLRYNQNTLEQVVL